jgi:phosphoserine phosphatase RsbU/P
VGEGLVLEKSDFGEIRNDECRELETSRDKGPTHMTAGGHGFGQKVALKPRRFARLMSDLRLAQDVQTRLLPQKSLSSAGLVCESYYQPLHGVGGDYYDFIPLNASKVGIAIGDVSGKGVAAALIMATLQAALRTCLLRPGMSPHQLIRNLNHLLYELSLSQVFASLFYGEYDSGTGLLRYVNAGHNPPLLVRSETEPVELLRLESVGMLLGVVPDAEYEERTCNLDPGDLLVAYTDGITESSSHADEQWGQSGLESFLARCAKLTPAEIVRAILKGREALVDQVAPEDDMTLVVISVEGRPPVWLSNCCVHGNAQR